MKLSNKVLTIFVAVTAFSAFIATALIYEKSKVGGNSIENPSFIIGKSIEGDGHLLTQVKPIQPFSGIAIKSWANVEVRHGDKNQVVISTDENLLSHMKIEVRNHYLSIGGNKNINLNPSQAMNIIVTTTSKNLSEISTSGKVKLNESNINSNNLNMNIAGENDITLSGSITQAQISMAGKSNIDLCDDSAKKLQFNMTGRSHVDLCGNADTLILNSAGRSRVNAEKLIVNHLMVHGAGNMTISSHVLESIHVDAFGKVVVNYLGDPKTIDKRAFGNVVIQKINK